MRRSLVLWLVVGLLGLACAANATTLTYTGHVPPPPENTPWTATIFLPYFNPALGELKSVTLSGTADVWGTMRFENTGPKVDDITIWLSAGVNMDMPDIIMPDIAVTPTIGNTYSGVPGFDGVMDWGGTSGLTNNIPWPGATAGNSASTTDALALAWFTGSGSWGIACTGAALSGGYDTNGNFACYHTTNADAWATVVYEYDAIPEMGTLSLAAMGLLSLPIWRRRK